MSPPSSDARILSIYQETIRPLYAYVARRVGSDRPLAEDLVQETWMRAVDSWHRKGIPQEPQAWLNRVARNEIVNHFRRRRPEPVDPARLDRLSESAVGEAPDIAAAVSWGMSRLLRSHAEVLEAFYFEGKTVREIAADHSMSERAVEGRLRRARARLRKQLERLRTRAARLDRPTAAGGTKNVRST